MGDKAVFPIGRACATFYFLDIMHDTDITADCLGSSSLEKPHALRNVRCSSAVESRVEWQTSRKKFLARNYSGGPGVTTESIADGCQRFLVSRRSDAL